MSTEKETVSFILSKLTPKSKFLARPMFGEYGLYADSKIVGLICDNQLFVKILPESAELEELCMKAPPYNGAKDYYLVEEEQLSNIPELSQILFRIAEKIPEKRVKKKVGD